MKALEEELERVKGELLQGLGRAPDEAFSVGPLRPVSW
jgi:hypothetical protein